MAEIRVEKKSGSQWMWWLLGLVVLALIIWMVASALDDDQDEVGVATVPAMEETAVTTPAVGVPSEGIPIGEIVASPAAWSGRSVSGEVRVTEVVSDRGFWVEQDGQRLFVLLNEVPGEIKEINAGQTIHMAGAIVHATDDPDQVPGNLDPQAQQIVGNQPAVLTVDSRNVDIRTVS